MSSAVHAAKQASAAMRELAESARAAAAAMQQRAGHASTEALTDALRRNQSPELIAALKRALGLT